MNNNNSNEKTRQTQQQQQKQQHENMKFNADVNIWFTICSMSDMTQRIRRRRHHRRRCVMISWIFISLCYAPR